MTKSPLFALVAIGTLVLGIGANTSIFTVVDSILLRPLPYFEPEQLTLVYGSTTDEPGDIRLFSYPYFAQIDERCRSLSGIAAFTSESFNLTGSGDPEQINSARVSGNFFDVLGVKPKLGRTFRADEDRVEGDRVVLLSHELWLKRFGGTQDIVGKNIELDSQVYTVIGVLKPGFTFPFLPSNTELWVTKIFNLNIVTPEHIRGGVSYLSAVGRLRPGATLDQARSELAVLTKQYQRENPAMPDVNPKKTVSVDNLAAKSVENLRPTLLILLGAVGFILLIACANVASLLLSRAVGRKKEIAVRTALGAGRGAIIRQLLTESLILAAVSGALGIGVGIVGTRILLALTPAGLVQVSDVHINLAVLAFTVIISLLSGVIFGLIPALQLSRSDVNSALRDEGRGSTGGKRRAITRQVLVVAQVAMSIVLLVGAGLLIRSFARLQASKLGFDAENVMTMRIVLPPARYGTPAEMISFYRRTLEDVKALPGVREVAISSALPVNPTRQSPTLMEGQPQVPIAQRPIINIQTISPKYAEVMRVQLLAGREFSDHDDADAPSVAIVNEALTSQYWPNENAIGKHVWLGRRTTPTEIVGVFGDIKNSGIADRPQPELMLPFPQFPWATLNLSVRTAVEPHSVVSEVRDAIAKIDPDQPITGAQTLQEILVKAKAQPRFTTFLLGTFSGVALLLAVVGIYGVIGYSVAQRTQEMGIRLALGASSEDILKLVIAYGLGLAAIGIVIGLAGAAALTRLMSTQLYQTSVFDPLTFIVSAAIFLLAALLASYLPALRAMRIDPVDAIRYE